MAVILQQRFQLRLQCVVRAGSSSRRKRIYNYAVNKMNMLELPQSEQVRCAAMTAGVELRLLVQTV